MGNTLDSRGSRVLRKCFLRAAVAVAFLGSPGHSAGQLARDYEAQLERQVATAPISSSLETESRQGVETESPQCADSFQEETDQCQAELDDARNLCANFETGLLDKWCASGMDCSRFHDACRVANTANIECIDYAFEEFSFCKATSYATSYLYSFGSAALLADFLKLNAQYPDEDVSVVNALYEVVKAIRERAYEESFCAMFPVSTESGRYACEHAQRGERSNLCQVVGDSCVPR